ncbi:mitochondrial import inner membrane translocase subunit Tim21-like [Dendronephthya gigantea]|uniref:mitochondrial import inner membrane translocase subunit Tim21-like n=1 Tax=Dendronephthya gigantea TaxID=151771 RepID=UPI00106CFA87|nr:mitochondrial import inner membrane translocase subunit Tim21-like [Dendronephthya gigantea]
MIIFWLNKGLNPFKVNYSSAFSINSISVLRNAVFSSHPTRNYGQNVNKPSTLNSNALREYCINILQRRKGFVLCSFCTITRQFHGGNASVRFQEKKKPDSLQELVESTEKQQTALTTSQKVAQAGKDVSYFAIILAGFAVTGALLWYVLSELFLSSSPNKIYADALKKVKQNEEVLDALGEPIKAYGEETSRGRRRHVSFQEYIVAGENYMRVKFYVSGTHRKGTVHVDVKQVSSRRYEYRFIFVELEGFPFRTIIIEDNRYETDTS